MNAQLGGADCILAIGAYTLAPLVYTGAHMIPEGAKLIQIDANPMELGKNFAPAVAIHADPLSAIEELRDALKPLLVGAAAEKVWRRGKIVADMIADGRAKFIE